MPADLTFIELTDEELAHLNRILAAEYGRPPTEDEITTAVFEEIAHHLTAYAQAEGRGLIFTASEAQQRYYDNLLKKQANAADDQRDDLVGEHPVEDEAGADKPPIGRLF